MRTVTRQTKNRTTAAPAPVVAAPPMRDVVTLVRSADGQDAFDPLQTLRGVNVAPLIVEDFRPLTQSLEWRLSELHWRTSGLSSFVLNEVPYAVNNSGSLSTNAAALLFANCAEMPPQETLSILELGAGSGLFARYLLDEFRRLCRQHEKDFYDRLVYYVSDGSPRTAKQWLDSGQFSEHGEHVLTGVCDATQPSRFHATTGETIMTDDLRAVFANYVLDSLPTSVMRRGESGAEELHVRTHLTPDTARLRQYTQLNLEQIRALVESDDADDRARLISLVSLFEFELEFRPSSPPYADEALTFGHDLERVLLNHGAISCIENCRTLLAPEGFMLASDYGPLQHGEVAQQSVSQRFGPSTAFGLNFPLIENHFSMKGGTVLKPEDDQLLPVHPRLFLKGKLPQTRQAFLQSFGGAAYRAVEEPVERARQHVEAGRLEQAKELYETALTALPRDWRLIGEVAEFVIRELTDYTAGEQLARAALAINPWYSVWLWNILGDALFCLERFDEAHEAYVHALDMDASDVRTNLNLSYTYARRGEHKAALDVIAAALAHDRAGQFREKLLEKQQEILQMCTAKWTGEQEWMARRAARLYR